MEKIILIGGGGHCKSVIDVIEAEGKYSVAGIIDVKEKVGIEVLGYPVIGTIEDLEKLRQQYNNFHISVGHITSNENRIKLYDQIKKSGGFFPVIVSPLARVSKSSQVGEGTVIMHYALVNSNAVLGVNCIINNHSLVEHDCKIGDHCHLATGSIVNGGCMVGDHTFVGSNAVIIQGVRVGVSCIIGSGSVIIRDTVDSGTYVGNPGGLIG